MHYGCGMGNLSVMAVRSRNLILAGDANSATVSHLRQRTQAENLPLQFRQVKARHTILEGCHHTVLATGLFMFKDFELAYWQVER